MPIESLLVVNANHVGFFRTTRAPLFNTTVCVRGVSTHARSPCEVARLAHADWMQTAMDKNSHTQSGHFSCRRVFYCDFAITDCQAELVMTRQYRPIGGSGCFRVRRDVNIDRLEF